MNETNSDNECEEESMLLRPKTPSRYVKREHPESHILGEKREGVHTIRKLVGGKNLFSLALLSQTKPKNLYQVGEDKF